MIRTLSWNRKDSWIGKNSWNLDITFPSPPMPEFHEFFWETFSFFWEFIFPCLLFCENARSNKFCESICHYLRVCFSDIFSNFCKSARSMIDRLQYKHHPFFSKKRKEWLSVWATAFGRTYHEKSIIDFFFKAKNLLFMLIPVVSI